MAQVAPQDGDFLSGVTPAKAGVQEAIQRQHWLCIPSGQIPAFAGMTKEWLVIEPCAFQTIQCSCVPMGVHRGPCSRERSLLSCKNSAPTITEIIAPPIGYHSP